MRAEILLSSLAMNNMTFKRLFYSFTISLCLLMTACTNDPALKLGVTTTLEDSGLLSVLVDAFKKEHNISIKPIIAGSGQIHELIRRGDIDTAITHDPSGEKKLLAESIIAKRTELMQNDFLIIGPTDDPAHIKLSLTPDEAFEKIAYVKAPFVSRADQSGTHQMEQYWWQQANTLPSEKNYIKTGTGMGATLAITAEHKGYTLVDRGTWLQFANKQGLTTLFEAPELLPNRYSLLSLKNVLNSDHVSQWENWLTEGTGRTIISNYRINNQPIFFDSQ